MDLRERPAADFQRHPWETARAKFVARLLRDHHLLPGAKRVLDVGAGDAWLAGRLAEANREAEFVCWDSFYTGEDIEAISRANISAQTAAPGGTFDLATALDVLEHVDDDAQFLAAIRERVRPAGTLLITVPAHPLLWTRHDELLEHRRRYTAQALRTLISSADLQWIGGGSFFHSLLAPRALAAVKERLRSKRPSVTELGEWRASSVVTRAVLAALAIDNEISRLAARVSVPLPGLSLWALCRRPS